MFELSGVIMSVFKDSASYRPFSYPFAMEASQKHSIDMVWDINSIDLQDDLRQYNSKDGLKTKAATHETNKYIIDTLTCLFTQMDMSVAGGYVELLPYIKNNEIRCWLLTAAQREVVHQRAYALLAETFGFSDSDWSAFTKYKEMRDKIDAMTDSSNIKGRDEYKAAVILSRTLIGEAVGLFGAFTCFLNYKRKGLLMGFNAVNQWSLLDENHHVDTNIEVLAEICKDLTDKENKSLSEFIKKTINLFVKTEHEFIKLVYAMGEQDDLTEKDLSDYISYLGERLQWKLGLLQVWNVRSNPLEWMEWLLSAKRHDNFFETRVTDYTHAGLQGTVSYDRYK